MEMCIRENINSKIKAYEALTVKITSTIEFIRAFRTIFGVENYDKERDLLDCLDAINSEINDLKFKVMTI